MDLTVRSYNCLRRAGANTAEDVLLLVGNNLQALLAVRNLSPKCIREILTKLKRGGFSVEHAVDNYLLENAGQLDTETLSGWSEFAETLRNTPADL